MPRAALPAALAAAVLAGCGTLAGEGPGEALAEFREFFGASDPIRHAGRLERHHRLDSFRHDPDLPPTWEACLEEIGVLARSRYADWREIGVAVFVLTRVATEDSGALHRAEAVRALRAIGGRALEEEDPPAVPRAEPEVHAAMARFPILHSREDGTHLGAEAREECARLLGVLGDLRRPPPPVPAPTESAQALRLLYGALHMVLSGTRSDEAHAGPEHRAAADRAIANLSAQAVVRALAAAALHDRDPRVRAEAYDALGTLRPGVGMPILGIAYRRETSGPARARLVRAAAALSASGDGEVRATGVPILITALDDAAPTVRFHARDGLAAMAGEDLGDAPEPWIRWWSREKPGP